MELNEAGTHFPLWATCMGYQTMMLLESQQCDIIKYKGKRSGKVDPLNFEFNDQHQTRMYGQFSDDQILKISTQPVTVNFHSYSILLEDYLGNDNLSTNFTLLSTNMGDDDFEYISSVEHVKYPFYGIQFHVENNMYKFKAYDSVDPPHSEIARDLTSYFSQLFISEARKNNHTMDYEELVRYSVEAQGILEIHSDPLEDQYFFLQALP